MRNISIRGKLILLLIVPIASLVFYLGKVIRDEVAKKRSAEDLVTLVTLVDKVGTLVHNLQVERSLSLVYTYLKRQGDHDALIEQRTATDHAIKDVNDYLLVAKVTLENAWLLDSMRYLRRKTEQLNFTDRDNDIFIAGKNQILSQLTRLLETPGVGAIKNDLDNHLRVVYIKDLLALMRGQLAAALVNNLYDPGAYGVFYNNKAYRTFAATRGSYMFNLDQLNSIGDPEFRKILENKFRGRDVIHANAILDSAYRDPRLGTEDVDTWRTGSATSKEAIAVFDRWFTTASSAINSLKDVEDASAQLIQSKAEAEIVAARSSVNTAIVLGIVILAIVLAIAIHITRSTVEAVVEIKTAAEDLTKGKTDNIHLNLIAKDEIGELARAFNRIAETNREFSSVAATIGRGDYAVAIPIRSNNDSLGHALTRMKDDLQKLSMENIKRTWLLSGSSELNDRLRGEKAVRDLAQEVITKIVSYLDAQIGAIYLNENGVLTLVGSYAYQYRKNNLNQVRFGEGLIGQAALEKKPIVFSNVPDDYIKINSGLGETTPKNVLVFPFVYENDVKGVIEVGTVNTFTESHLQFMSMIGDNVAIAFNGAQSRTKMKELLEETQRQSEELQSQQEELKQSNEELTEKTSLLMRSEAELKAQQEELQQSNEELEEKANILEEQKEKIEVTKKEIEKKAEELETVSKYKTEFLANMSHELRTPLNSILVLSQLLVENKNGVLQEREIDFSRNIHNSGSDLLNLINEILDLSKVEAGKIQLDIETVSIKDVVTDAKSMFSELAKNKSIVFDINTGNDIDKTLSTDRLRLFQIVRNLLSNAFKFTDKNGKVTLSISQPGNSIIEFAVTDTGIGIPPDKQAIIFEAFQQADGSTKRKYGGTGLGLSICRELANALGGDIDVDSEVGKGSTFRLSLPMGFNPDENTSGRMIEIKKRESNGIKKKKHEQHAKPEITASDDDRIDDLASIRENDKVIVILEDDEAFAKVLLEFVRERNYKGIVATQGNTGLSYIRNHKPDAILLDMKLPVMDGNEVLKKLKSDPTLRHIPVQIISGHDMKKEAMALGAFDYLRKPVSTEMLQSTFDRVEDFVNKRVKKVLIVEDDQQQNKAIRELLMGTEIKCFSSYTGNDAYNILLKEQIDCIILDLGLPDMSDFELLDKIKANADLGKIPVIVYTGKDLTKNEVQRLNSISSTIVLKTVDSHERLLDETTLFLHQVESNLPKEKQSMIRNLYKSDEALKGRFVLLVDDDMRNIYSLSNVLKDEGVRCIVAENGLEAVNMLNENPTVDMVLMDVMMPEMDGYEATRAIRKKKNFEKLPIIALTAKAMKGDREKCLAAGMSDYASKPVDVPQLLALMKVWLYK